MQGQGAGTREQGTVAARVPHVAVHGTQSFVALMGEVWKRPSLTVMEVLWRWSFGVPFVLWLLWPSRELLIHDPRRAAAALQVWGWPPGLRVLTGALLAVVWTVASTFGRRAIFRLLQSERNGRMGTLFLLGLLRFFAFSWIVAMWWAMLVVAVRRFPPQDLASLDGSYVLGFAAIVCGTLLLFVVWAATSWWLQIATVVAATRNAGLLESFRIATNVGLLRGKLVEVNLVMGIVKVALLVLAMVFSACPLPFSSVETQTFLNCWWSGVFVWWLLASDYFHVVRAAAYLRLWQTYEIAERPGTGEPKAAS